MAIDKFVLNHSERFGSLAKLHAQQALRIADLEAKLILAKAATQHKHIRPITEFINDENYQALPVDALSQVGHRS